MTAPPDSPLPAADALLALALLAHPHGIRGELSAIVVAPPVLDPVELFQGRRLFLRAPKGNVREVRAESLRPHQDRWLIKLEGIDTRSDAELLRRHELCLPREQLPELPEGWYWEADLEGCRVIDRTLGEIGRAGGLDLGPAQPQLELERPDGSRVLIPWLRAYLREVNVAEKRIELELPGGFPGISDDEDLPNA